MPNCPICKTESSKKHGNTPYWICPNCDLWFQDPLPPKVLQNPEMPEPKEMGAEEVKINRAIADWLFAEQLDGRPGRTLDVGGSYPVFANRLMELGCDAWVIDMDLQVDAFPRVKGLRGDFEDTASLSLLRKQVPFKLVTFFNVFEHMYRPLPALSVLRFLVGDNGRVFMRIPQHDVSGFQRDLTPGHYQVHPFYHSRSSLLQALYELGDCFELQSWSPLNNYGQADLVLKPINHAPRIALGMIVKNEERDLPRLFESVKTVADEIFVVDTGSTDKTEKVCRAHGVEHFRTYTGASREDETGDWKLENFAKARNQYLHDIDEDGSCDWVLSLDADDELLTPDAVRRASYMRLANGFEHWIIDGGTAWPTHRIWRAKMGSRYEGWCHEFVHLPPHIVRLEDIKLRHHGAPSATQENANPRNLRILKLEWHSADANKRRPRLAFYIANTYKDARQYEDAAKWYELRIKYGDAGNYDELMFSRLYAARCYRWSKHYEEAEKIIKAAMTREPTWAEFGMELANLLYDQGRYVDAIEAALPWCDAPIPPTALFRETTLYTDGAPRLITHCHYQLKNLGQAVAWADLAAERIPLIDPGWEEFRANLRKEMMAENKAPSLINNTKPRIALCRAGAIGDILMTLNLLPAFREANPEHQIHYFCDATIGEQLRPIMLAAGVDAVMDVKRFGAWQKSYAKVVNLVGYPLQEGYPDKPMEKHLLMYFALEMGLKESYIEYEYCGAPHAAGSLPALTLRRPNRPRLNRDGLGDALPKDYATLQTQAGWSKYKQWIPGRWQRVINKLPFEVLPIDKDMGYTLQEAIALIANARIHLGIDSFGNHVTNYFWEDQLGGRRTPGVILWGSTQPSAAGYTHNRNICYNLPCQPCFREDPGISAMPRGACINPPRMSYADETPWKCMDNIDIDEVVDAACTLWEKTPGWKA